jgi:hypothetical protein
MKNHFAIQGRLIERRNGVRVRDDVRLARADTHDDATRVADTFSADGFTVWIYRVEAGSTTQPVYRSVDVLEPAPSAGRPRTEPGAAREPEALGNRSPGGRRRVTPDQVRDPPLPTGCGVVRTEGDGAR